jgi:hypothetical protein
MSITSWELHQEPHRHYKGFDESTGKWSWNVRKTRIAGVTSVLDESGDRLWQWAVGQSYIASERLTGAEGLMSRAYDAGLGPEAIRDKAALLGTTSHEALGSMAQGEWRGAKLEAAARADKLAADRTAVVGANNSRIMLFEPTVPVPPVVTAKDLWPRLRALEEFWAEHSVQPIESEQAVGSEKHVYAGTFDLYGVVDGRRTLLDAKNTNMPSWRHPVQLAAYENARREMGLDAASTLLVLYLTPYGTYTLFDVAQMGGYGFCRRTFLSQLRVTRAQRKLDAAITKIERGACNG